MNASSFEENTKFKVGVTYTATKGAYYHFSATCVSRTEKFVTFKIDDKAASRLHLSKLQVRRKCFDVNGVEMCTLIGDSVDSYYNWIVIADCFE